MAKVYGTASGEIMRVLQTEAEERLYPDPPPGATVALDFDEDTNGDVLSALMADWNAHDCVGGVLHRNGVAVTIAPPSAEYTDRQQLATYWTNLAAYLALGNPTNAQSVAAIKTIIRVLRLFYRVLRRSGAMAGIGK